MDFGFSILIVLFYLLIIATPVIILALLASGKTKKRFFWFYLLPTILTTLLMTVMLIEETLTECGSALCGLGTYSFLIILCIYQLITFLTISIRRKFFSSKKNKKILYNQLRIPKIIFTISFLVLIFYFQFFA